MLNAKVVGRIIRECRKKKGMSQAVFSDFAEIQRTHLSAIERGKRKPTMETFYKIGKQLGIGPSVLMKLVEIEMDSAQESKDEE